MQPQNFQTTGCSIEAATGGDDVSDDDEVVDGEVQGGGTGGQVEMGTEEPEEH